MAFRFAHTADIHLDSPLKSLALRDEEIADIVGNATRQALEPVCCTKGVVSCVGLGLPRFIRSVR